LQGAHQVAQKEITIGPSSYNFDVLMDFPFKSFSSIAGTFLRSPVDCEKPKVMHANPIKNAVNFFIVKIYRQTFQYSCRNSKIHAFVDFEIVLLKKSK
jgi:hypothetical protein